MNIKQVIDMGNSYIVDDTFTVPKDPKNTDYRELLAWIEAGGVVETYIEPEPTYAELRQAEYPSLAEQMDMQYWDAVNGTAIWAETISEIKARYPKP